MKWLAPFVFVPALIVSACGDGQRVSPDTSGTWDIGEPDAATHDTTVPSDADAVGDATSPDVAVLDTGPDAGGPLGGDRPAALHLPTDYDPDGSYPLVFLLHGYTGTGALQDAYFGLSGRVDEHDFILVIPEGTRDAGGNQFWNATPACCDFGNTGVNDAEYLTGLMDEALERYAVDPARIYFIGHSNGGYMSYRMACDVGDRIAAVVSLAGSSYEDASDCAEAGPVAALQIHGTADTTVRYDGMAGAYPGAEEVAQRWATRDECDADPVGLDPIDLDNGLEGAETTRLLWEGCAPGTSVELWTIESGAHIPRLRPGFGDVVLDFMFHHQIQ